MNNISANLANLSVIASQPQSKSKSESGNGFLQAIIENYSNHTSLQTIALPAGGPQSEQLNLWTSRSQPINKSQSADESIEETLKQLVAKIERLFR